MTDFGGKLRQARERRGVSLRQIAASTKISIGTLEALERNDVARLPGGIFSRAFVRSYALEVGLDPEETVREFMARFRSDPASSVATLTDEAALVESEHRTARLVLKIVVVGAALAGLILYFTLRSRPSVAAAEGTARPGPDSGIAEPAPSSGSAGAAPGSPPPAPRPAP